MSMANLVTFIGRVSDGMLLVATMENAFNDREYKSHAESILRNLNTSSPSRCTIQAGRFYFQYV